MRPKPMVEIGGMPMLWHIMKYYSFYGHTDFVICAGYKQSAIKEWFVDYYINHSDVTFDFSARENITIHRTRSEPWRVTVVDTGLSTMTGGRIKRIRQHVENEPFFLTYGDGVCDVDLGELLCFHRAHRHLVTITAVHPDSRFGVLDMSGNVVRAFREKSEADVDWINGGFMVLDPRVIDYIEGDDTVFEQAPLERLCADGELMAFRHRGFWQCMDTLRDREKLERLWTSGRAPWKRWS